MNYRLIGCLVLALLAACTSSTEEQKTGDNRFTAKTLQQADPLGSQYLVYLPKQYGDDTTTRWPLVVYLHGQSTSGSMPSLQAEGMMKYAAEHDLQAIVVAPLHPNPDWFVSPAFVDAAIREVSDAYRVNLNKVSLTGFSLGGFGAWGTAMAFPKRFSAVMILSGALPNDAAVTFGNQYPGAPQRPLPDVQEWTPLLSALSGTPTRVYHTPGDAAVPYSLGERSATLLQTAGGQVELIDTTAAHPTMPEAVYTPANVEWLLAQTRSEAVVAAQTIDLPARYAGTFVDATLTLKVDVNADGKSIRLNGSGQYVFSENFVHAGNQRFLGSYMGRFYQPDANGVYNCFAWPPLTAGNVFTRSGSGAQCMNN